MGGLVAFPTETVYGLGADARSPEAVGKIFAAKGRPADHPLIVHLPDASHLEGWTAHPPDLAYRLTETFWPGPLTLILKRAAGVSDAVTGGQETVGVRVPGHPTALALLEAFGGGVAAPSANRFGRISPTRAEHVRSELGDAVDLILDGGPCGVGLESTILDLSTGEPRVLRPGGTSIEALTAVLGFCPEVTESATVRVSGSLKSHYAPLTPVRLVETCELEEMAQNPATGVLARKPQPEDFVDEWITLPDEPEGYGRGLYAALRELDALGLEHILIERVSDTPEWLAVQDRLRRASAREVETT